jgi:Cu-Zn family superoxide dismutase
MNARSSIIAAVAITGLAACAAAPELLRPSSAQAATPTGAGARAALAGTGGANVGTATFNEGPRGVVIRVEGRGLPPGWHGVHLHQKGDCSDPAFQSAGGHTHGGPKSVHGLKNAQATDTGDLPNVFVAADGTLNAELFTAFVTLGGGSGRQALLDADGATLVLHANPDDHVSQPIGGAGARIACGVIAAER